MIIESQFAEPQDRHPLEQYFAVPMLPVQWICSHCGAAVTGWVLVEDMGVVFWESCPYCGGKWMTPLYVHRMQDLGTAQIRWYIEVCGDPTQTEEGLRLPRNRVDLLLDET